MACCGVGDFGVLLAKQQERIALKLADGAERAEAAPYAAPCALPLAASFHMSSSRFARLLSTRAEQPDARTLLDASCVVSDAVNALFASFNVDRDRIYPCAASASAAQLGEELADALATLLERQDYVSHVAIAADLSFDAEPPLGAQSRLPALYSAALDYLGKENAFGVLGSCGARDCGAATLSSLENFAAVFQLCRNSNNVMLPMAADSWFVTATGCAASGILADSAAASGAIASKATTDSTSASGAVPPDVLALDALARSIMAGAALLSFTHLAEDVVVAHRSLARTLSPVNRIAAHRLACVLETPCEHFASEFCNGAAAALPLAVSNCSVLAADELAVPVTTFARASGELCAFSGKLALGQDGVAAAQRDGGSLYARAEAFVARRSARCRTAAERARLGALRVTLADMGEDIQI